MRVETAGANDLQTTDGGGKGCVPTRQIKLFMRHILNFIEPRRDYPHRIHLSSELNSHKVDVRHRSVGIREAYGMHAFAKFGLKQNIDELSVRRRTLQQLPLSAVDLYQERAFLR